MGQTARGWNVDSRSETGSNLEVRDKWFVEPHVPHLRFVVKYHIIYKAAATLEAHLKYIQLTSAHPVQNIYPPATPYCAQCSIPDSAAFHARNRILTFEVCRASRRYYTSNPQHNSTKLPMTDPTTMQSTGVFKLPLLCLCSKAPQNLIFYRGHQLTCCSFPLLSGVASCGTQSPIWQHDWGRVLERAWLRIRR